MRKKSSGRLLRTLKCIWHFSPADPLPLGEGERAQGTGEGTLILYGEERDSFSPDSLWVNEEAVTPRRMPTPQAPALLDNGDHSAR